MTQCINQNQQETEHFEIKFNPSKCHPARDLNRIHLYQLNVYSFQCVFRIHFVVSILTGILCDSYHTVSKYRWQIWDFYKGGSGTVFFPHQKCNKMQGQQISIKQENKVGVIVLNSSVYLSILKICTRWSCAHLVTF